MKQIKIFLGRRWPSQRLSGTLNSFDAMILLIQISKKTVLITMPDSDFYSFQTGMRLGGQRPKGWGQFWRSVTHFSAPKVPKNWNFWKFFGKNWVK